MSDGDVVVSAMITTEASRPLAPCTVITRTSSREISMSRFTSVSAARSQAMKPCSEAGALRLVGERQFEEFVERIIGLVAEPAQDARAALIAAKQPGIERKRRLGAKALLAFDEPVERILEPAGLLRHAPSAPSRSEPLRFHASAKRSSSLRLNSGLFSATASARSSCGSSSASARFIRSMIAMCSVSFSRSAPATGMPACFSAWMTASNRLPRRRTSTSTSP